MMNDIYNDSIDKIRSQVKEWTYDNIGPDFKFRDHQLDCIIHIIDNIVNHKYSNYVVEAPTGSGKSLINMIAAAVLDKYYNMSSYILVSDLFLWDQYEKFLRSHNKIGIASIKGQSGNYLCELNGQDIVNADCRMCGLSWAAMFNKSTVNKYGYDCAMHCSYVNVRKNALKANVCVMTYQLFMMVMANPLAKEDGKAMQGFMRHDIIFCDECHNIPEIVQMQYATTISESQFDKLHELYSYKFEDRMIFSENKDVDSLYIEYPNWQKLYKEIKKYFDVWISAAYANPEDDLLALKSYIDILNKIKAVADAIKADMRDAKENKEPISKEQQHMFKLSVWLDGYLSGLLDLATLIDLVGTIYLLKDVNVSMVDGKQNISVSFKCTKEDIITYEKLLCKADYTVMTSATVGTKESFCERIGFQYNKKSDFESSNIITDDPYIERLPSTFDFANSPIWFLDKFKMSYRERDVSFECLKKAVYSICDGKFKSHKGMIQTGSYHFAKKLYDDAPPQIRQRILLYNGSREKVSIVRLHQMATNTILVGPTLNTGIDLPGDNCRFIIILKVPYPNLSDKLTNARNKLYPLWYASHTSNEIIQGIGRGVRYDGDWCVTYILDACFAQLYASTKDQYPMELQERIKTV